MKFLIDVYLNKLIYSMRTTEQILMWFSLFYGAFLKGKKMYLFRSYEVKTEKNLFTSILENYSHVKFSESLVNFSNARKFTILKFDNQNYLHLRNINLINLICYKIQILLVRIVILRDLCYMNVSLTFC